MSNQAIVDIRKFEDDVIVLVEDDYGKTFQSYEPDSFNSMSLIDVLNDVSNMDEMDGFFSIVDDEVVLDRASSLEVHGFDENVHVFTREGRV